MYIESHGGKTEDLLAEYRVTRSVDGNPEIEADSVVLSQNHDTPITMKSDAFPDGFVMVTADQSALGKGSIAEFKGVHKAAYDMKHDWSYIGFAEEGAVEKSMTQTEALESVFSGTGYTFTLENVTESTRKLSDFGNADRLSLITKICETWGLEYAIQNSEFVFKEVHGSDTGILFRYNLNITDARINIDLSSIGTYIKGLFGGPTPDSAPVIKEYKSPLADRYGLRHVKPVT